jgi:hypothetical protein
VWWYIPVIPTLGSCGKRDCKFWATLGYIVRSYHKTRRNEREKTIPFEISSEKRQKKGKIIRNKKYLLLKSQISLICTQPVS